MLAAAVSIRGGEIVLKNTQSGFIALYLMAFLQTLQCMFSLPLLVYFGPEPESGRGHCPCNVKVNNYCLCINFPLLLPEGTCFSGGPSTDNKKVDHNLRKIFL